MTETQPQQGTKAPVAPAMLICPKCGRANSLGTRYCIICDTSLAGVAQAARKVMPQTRDAKVGFFSRLFGRRR